MLLQRLNLEVVWVLEASLFSNLLVFSIVDIGIGIKEIMGVYPEVFS